MYRHLNIRISKGFSSGALRKEGIAGMLPFLSESTYGSKRSGSSRLGAPAFCGDYFCFVKVTVPMTSLSQLIKRRVMVSPKLPFT